MYNFQNMPLFGGTILENITYGINSHNNKTDILRFIKKTESDFVNKLPLGTNTVISSDGKSLSGGECQKVNLMRALLKSPKIYLFDEPTSNMDSISLQAMQSVINEIKGKSTVILITHNAEMIRNAEIVLKMDNGILTERHTSRNLVLQQ